MNSNIIQWTKAHEIILKEWKAKAFAYLWLQSNSCYFYISIYNWLAYVVVVLSSFAAVTMFLITNSSSMSSSINNCSYTSIGIPIIIVQYIIGSLSLLSAILTGVIRQLKPGEMYQQHASMAKRYNNLIRSIDVCLSLTRSLRPDPSVFIDKIGTELENLADNQVEAPLLIIKKFERTYGPIDRILYGEDVVELWKIRYNTNKMERMIIKKSNEENKLSTINSTATTFSIDIYNDVAAQNQNTEDIPEPIPVDVKPVEIVSQRRSGDFTLNNINEPFKTSLIMKNNWN